jgi:FkbM family methyltransferase
MVEPDPEEAARLRAKGCNVLEVALLDKQGPVTLNVTRSPGASSVFQPYRAFLEQFPEVERFHVSRSISVNAVSLDALPPREIDFLKIDTQGAELAIMEGGVNRLQRLVGLEVEVEFGQMYEGQPLFADVDRFVRERLGLELWDIRRTHWKYKDGLDSNTSKGRLIFGDALYLRPMTSLDTWLPTMGDEASNKLAMLAVSAIAYGFLDYAQALSRTRSLAPGVMQLISHSIARGAFRPLRNGSWPLFILFDAIAKAFRPTHGGWATGGEVLGSRRRGAFWC